MRSVPSEPVLFALASAFAACTLSNEGIAPPAGEFHYPIAVALSPPAATGGPAWLYTVNSDFNLKYNGGRVNVVDLNRVRACMRDTGGIHCAANTDCPTASTCTDGYCRCTRDSDCNIPPDQNDPRVCTHTCVAPPAGITGASICAAPSTGQVESNFLSRSADASVQINPFATAAALRRPITAGSPSRLYITVRGDGTLTWIDANEDHLTCYGSGGPLCDEAHRVGHQQSASPRGLILPPLPVTLDIGDADRPFDGNILVVHQEYPRARASLFFDPPGGGSPSLVHWLGDLSPDLDAIVRAPDDPSDSTAACMGVTCALGQTCHNGACVGPHFYVLSRDEPVINQLRVQSSGETSFLYRARGDFVLDLASDVGIRAAVLDPCDAYRMANGLSRHMYATARPSGINTTAYTDPTLYQMPGVIAAPVVASSPEQLIDFDITDPENVIAAHVMSLPTGPSQLVAIPPTGGCGTGPVLAYTVSYDARKLYVIDVDHWVESDEIRTERGPNFPVFDPVNRQLFLVDFAAMVIQVIDVNESSPTYHQVLFTIGDPVLPDIT